MPRSVVKHKIELTLDQLVAVRQVVTNSRDMLANNLADPHLQREYSLRENGEVEWQIMQDRCALLSDSLLAM